MNKLPLMLLALSLGCGGALSSDVLGELDSFEGTLTNPDALAVSGDVGVAVIWFGGTAESAAEFNVAQTVNVSSEFPSGFTINLTSAPPASSMTDWDMMDDKFKTIFPKGAAYALGTLVAYEDMNGNGSLDLVESGTAAPIDRLVGADEGLLVLYLQGGLPQSPEDDLLFTGTKLGYNVVQLPNCLFGASDCEDNVSSTVNEKIELTLSASPKLSSLLCKSSGTASSSGQTISMGDAVPEKWHDPSEITCDATGQSYTFSECTVGADFCNPTTSCTEQIWNNPDPEIPPDGWPCSV